MPHQLLAEIISNQEIAKDHFVLTCRAPEIAIEALPGHFINTRVAEEGCDPLLRKPFSIYTVDRDQGIVSILYSIVGATTRGMSRKRPGDKLDLVGPLGGRLFRADPRPHALHIMVGGGYGVPPLVFLSRELLARDKGSRIAFLIGARTKDLLLCEQELRDTGIATHSSTEDGTHGVRGRVTDVLAPLIAKNIDSPMTVYCCGSTSMMQAVAAVCAESSIPCQVSLEVAMPCGVGVCMGCVLDLKDGSRVRCCTDGPVFDALEVAW